MTDFEKQVYSVVKSIPYGQVLTYQEVARRLGKPRAARAVGNALNKNVDPTVPCHRVIRSSGEIGGFRCGSWQKVVLLAKEGFIR